MRLALCIAFSLLLVGCGGGSPLTLNQTNLDRVHEDMTPAEVQTIMGPPTESHSDPIPVVGGTQTTYTYRNNNSEVTIIFKNDKMKEKHGSFN